MATLSKDERHYRAQIAALSRDRGPDDLKLVEVRESYRCAKYSARIRRIVDEAPPLPLEDLEYIAKALGMRVVHPKGNNNASADSAEALGTPIESKGGGDGSA